ncbi:homocysteine S-methyltransferase [Quadrisphaera sp. KR29]|uniref:homocysteine S-methyltransferase n=1 Tax=Quadrisphaera sp. KR29 TaxID=3461391 RepID=UPI004044C94C
MRDAGGPRQPLSPTPTPTPPRVPASAAGPAPGPAPGPAAGLAAALERGPVLLDGGLSTELEARGHDVSSALWSARLLMDDPGAVVGAHAAFAAAGARVLTTASYQATLPGLVAAGLDRAAAARVITSSLALAREGLALAGREGWVAGSVGPYGALLADGSEYTGAYLGPGPGRVDARMLREHHRPHLELLAAAGADVLACETLPGAAEVEALLPELEALGAPAWVSLGAVLDARGTARTRRGEQLAPLLAAAASVSCVLAVGVNCLDPSSVLPALRQAAGLLPPPASAGAHLLAYPNSGETWDAAARAWSGPPAGGADDQDAAVAGAPQWVRAGAHLVGGCCRVRPHHTAATAAVLAGVAPAP